MTERHNSTKLFHEKLSMLNDNLIKFLQKQHAKKPYADLTPTLNDYFNHLRTLDQMYSSTPESDLTSPKPAQTVSNQFPSFITPVSVEKTSETTLTSTTVTATITPTSTAPTFPLVSPKPLFGGFSQTSKDSNGINSTTTLSTSTFTIPTLPASIASTRSDNLFSLPKTTNSLPVEAPTRKLLKRSADTSIEENGTQKKQLFPSISANQLPTFPSFSTQKTTGEITSTTPTFTSNMTTTTTAPVSSAAPPFVFGSSKPAVNLFSGTTSSLFSTPPVETTKDNNVSAFKPTLFTPFSEKTNGGTNSTITKTTLNLITPINSTTTTTSSVPTFSFGGSLSKPFGGSSNLSSNLFEAPKENNVSSALKFPSTFPSFFPLDKTTGGLTAATTTSTTTSTASTVSTFSFGLSSKPSLFGGISSSLFSSSTVEAPKNNNDNEEDGDDKPEEFTPKDNFQPIVPLPSKIETKSGEENEEIVFEARCRLFRFDKADKEYKTRGTGDLKILFDKQKNRYRCVARNSEGLSKLFANFVLFANFKVEKKEKPNCLIWRCKDSSENIEGSDETFLAKFRDGETAQKFSKKVEEIVSGLSSSA
uniref:RanBD1 domain-containing protein n=1 Tax=Meloidogyne incognita TaxID=6306 RepID=A0A914MWP2_MELIC